MKLFISFLFISSALLFTSCTENRSTEKVVTENALHAAHEFLSALFKGDKDKAMLYMIDDAENYAHLTTQIKQLDKKNLEDKEGYGSASIIFDNGAIDEVSPKETIIHYKNSYDRIARKLKLVKVNNGWLVDFKYTFNPNM